MQKSQENKTSTSIQQQTQKQNKLFQLIYSVNVKNSLRSQLHSCLTIANSIIILIIYLSLEHAAFLNPFMDIKNQVVMIVLFSIFSVIIIQFGIGVLYKKHFMLKAQLLVYRNLVFPITFYSFMHFQGDNLQSLILDIIGCFFTIALILIYLLIGKQSYYKDLIFDNGFPISSIFLIFQIVLFKYSSKTSYNKLCIFLMLLISIITKFVIIDTKIRRSKCLQYTLFRIQASLNLIYVAFILVQQICQPDPQDRQPFGFIFPLLLIVIGAEFFHQYSDIMKPISYNFFNSNNNVSEFLECVQYIADDIDKLANSQNQQVTRTCLIPIYYEHLKHCKMFNCPISHHFDYQTFNNTGKYKSLFSVVFKITQQLFSSIMAVHHQNLDLKFGLLKFYMKAGPNKLKTFQMISQVQTFELSWYQKLKVYQIKKYVSDFDVKQLIESIKIQDQYQCFNQCVSTLMKYLIQFWTQYLQDRVDFMKVYQISQKITPMMNSIQSQLQNSIEKQNFSTIRIMRTYSDYARWIMNNELKSATIRSYTDLLSKKISEIHQINCISADIQIALIAISLNVKNLGQIKIANSQAANIFNYNKQQFANQNVNNIMPNLIAVHHNDFLKQFIINETKKVNTDRRLLYGKRKQDHIFELYLQLQKSVVTSSQQIIFISSIELAKTTQAFVLVICDDKGLISNKNTTYQQLFVNSMKKNKSYEFTAYTNIQQLIPSFFDIVLDQNKQVKEIIQCYDNPVFGIIQIKFQISKLSCKYAKNMGYVIKGYRLSEIKQHFFNHLSLTSSLTQLAQQKQLKGHKVNYSSHTNQYLFDQNLDVICCGEFQSQLTIPYVKVQLFGKVLSQNLQPKVPPQYDAQIKTIRFLGDHFQRVQQPESFESQISQQQKTTINNSKYSLIKEELQREQNKGYRNFLRLAAILFLFVKIIWMFLFYVTVLQQKNQTQKDTQIFVEANHFREKISQYILYFQAQQDENFGYFFSKNKKSLQSQLIKSITLADISQNQKQRALKVAYLQETLKSTSFSQLINDQTIFINIVQKRQREKNWKIFEGMFGLLLFLKLLFNFLVMKWHQYKITGIFSLFLGLSESSIKQSHKRCVQFLKDSNQALNKVEQDITCYQNEVEQSSQQGSHLKVKRFKNKLLGRSWSIFLKLNVFTLLFTTVTAIMLTTNYLRVVQIQMQKNTYQFLSTVMPQYSTRLMKLYSNKKQNTIIRLQQSFVQKYQIIDYKLSALTVTDINNMQNFISVLFNDQCVNSNFDLPNQVKCQSLCGGVMKNGVSKAINYLSHRIAILEKTIPTKQTFKQLTQLSVLLYHIIKPKINEIKQQFKKGFQHEQQQNKIEIFLFFILLLSVALSNTIYQCNYPLQAIYKSVKNSKLLMNLIPKLKKKTKNGYTQI